jgi:hypothetical protein
MSEICVAAPSQPLQALQRANHIRIARSDLKARIADGQLSAAEVILASPSELASMPIAQLLASQHGWGEVRTRAFLNRVPLPPGKLIGSLTNRQRHAVASLLTRQTAARMSIAPDPL